MEGLVWDLCVLFCFLGSPYYDNVRPLSYPDSDAVLICFDISRPETLDSVLKKVSAEDWGCCAALLVIWDCRKVLGWGPPSLNFCLMSSNENTGKDTYTPKQGSCTSMPGVWVVHLLEALLHKAQNKILFMSSHVHFLGGGSTVRTYLSLPFVCWTDCSLHVHSWSQFRYWPEYN